MIEKAQATTTTSSNELATLSAGIRATLVGKFAGRGVQFAGQVVLARVLGPEGFGLYALGWTLLGILRMVAPLGLEHGVVRFGAGLAADDSAALRALLDRSFRLTLGASSLFGAALLLFAGPLAVGIFDEPRVIPLLQIFAVACPFAALVRVGSAATRITRRMSYSVVSEDLSQPVAALALILAFHWLGWGVTGAAVATSASFAIALLVAWACLVRAMPDLRGTRPRGGPRTRELLLFSVPAMIAATLNVLLVLVDRVIIGHFWSVHEVGIYQAVSQSSAVFLVILNAINTVFAALIPGLDSGAHRDRLAEMLRVSTKWVVFLSVPPALVFCLLPGPAIEVLFGHAYASGAPALQLLALAQIANVAVGQIGLVMIMTGRQTHWLKLTAGAFVVNILLNVALVPRLGTVGAAVSGLASMIILLVASVLAARTRLGTAPVDRRFLKGMVAAGGAAAVLLALPWVLPAAPLLQLVVGALLAVVVFGGILAAQGLDPEDRELLRALRTRYARTQGATQ